MGHIGLHQPEPLSDELFEATAYQVGEYLGHRRISAYSGLLGAAFEKCRTTKSIIRYAQQPLIDNVMGSLPKDSQLMINYKLTLKLRTSARLYNEQETSFRRGSTIS